MKILLPLLPLMISAWCFGQRSSTLDIVYSIDYTYRILTAAGESPNLQTIMDLRSRETRKLNYRMGFNYNLQITDRIHVKSGLRAARLGYKYEIQLRWPSENLNGEWKPDPNLPHEATFLFDYVFTEVPLMLRYDITRLKFAAFVEGGVSPSWYMISSTKYQFDGKRSVQLIRRTDFNDFHIVGNISVGLQYQFTPAFMIFGQPFFRYHFTPLIDAPIKERLTSLGLEFGIRKGI